MNNIGISEWNPRNRDLLKIWRLIISGDSALIAAKWLYNDASLYLNRKHEMAMKWIVEAERGK